MNKKHLITLFILVLMTTGSSNAIDYIPEIGMDPYYSLNELTETNDEDFPVAQDNIINLLKKKFAESSVQREENAKIRAEKRAEKKALKEQQKIEKEQLKLQQKQEEVEVNADGEKKRRGAFWWLEETEEDEEFLTEEERLKKLEIIVNSGRRD